MPRHVRYTKLVGFWLSFMLLHYAYKLAPSTLTRALAAVDESIFQHAKITFFAYVVASLGEHLVRRRYPVESAGFIVSRLFSTIIVPWLMMLIWYTGPALWGRLYNVALEVLFANVVLLLAGGCAIVLEEAWEPNRPTLPLWVTVAGLFLISVVLYVVFSFRMPWHDVFAEPTALARWAV